MADTPQQLRQPSLFDAIRALGMGASRLSANYLGLPGDLEAMAGVGTRWGTRTFPGSEDIRPQIEGWMQPFLPADSGWRPPIEARPEPQARTQAPQLSEREMADVIQMIRNFRQ